MLNSRHSRIKTAKLVRSGRGFDSRRLHPIRLQCCSAVRVSLLDQQTYWVGPTWFRRGEDAEADGSKDDARNAHNLVNANDDVYAVAA